jgi:xanthosine utilization system XapX-like protein
MPILPRHLYAAVFVRKLFGMIFIVGIVGISIGYRMNKTVKNAVNVSAAIDTIPEINPLK